MIKNDATLGYNKRYVDKFWFLLLTRRLLDYRTRLEHFFSVNANYIQVQNTKIFYNPLSSSLWWKKTKQESDVSSEW